MSWGAILYSPMGWQKRARYGVAAFGIAFAIVVYAAIGEREAAVPLARPERLDPRTILESADAVFRQFREAEQDYLVEAERQLLYEDGATRLIGVTIKMSGRAGRDFTVSAREGRAGSNEKELELVGGVTLTASDGFMMTAERASFSEADALITAPGPIAFQKGGMTGSGLGMSYDQVTDTVVLMEQAQVEVKGEGGSTVTAFTAGTATLARQDHTLELEGMVNARRGEQLLQAERGVARFNDTDEQITFIELRGNARVAGGGPFDSITARDIDLDYTDDGETVERAVLAGAGAITLTGRDGVAGRQFLGESLDLTFGPDGSLTAVKGRQNVRVDFPAAPGTAARSVSAGAIDAAGAPGTGLTSARFEEDVTFREALPGRGTPRTARSRTLRFTLDADVVTTATFTGGVQFDDQGLQASGANALYDPAKGTLQLSSAAEGGGPRVSDDQVAIEADTIDVTLQGRSMAASGNVKATLHPRSATDGRLPGLLEPDQAATVNAGALDYRGTMGQAIFSGRATLVQGPTAIRSNLMTLDQSTGDLTASGAATASLVLDMVLWIGRAAEIGYDEAARRLTYRNPVTPTPGVLAPASSLSQLSGPQGDLRAGRIEVILSEDRIAERLEAYTSVDLRLDARTATGDRLTYYADEGRYVMSGLATTPVKIVDACRETTGRIVTFYKSGDRLIVDGSDETRTQSKRGEPCLQPLPAAR